MLTTYILIALFYVSLFAVLAMVVYRASRAGETHRGYSPQYDIGTVVRGATARGIKYIYLTVSKIRIFLFSYCRKYIVVVYKKILNKVLPHIHEFTDDVYGKKNIPPEKKAGASFFLKVVKEHKEWIKK